MNAIRFVPLWLALALVGCQSTPPTPAKAPAVGSPATVAAPAPVPVEASTISVEAAGFSPLAQNPANQLSVGLRFGSPDRIQGWSVDFVGPEGTSVRSVKGDGARLPPTLTWDGRSDSGLAAPEGTYRARLSVDYGSDPGMVTAESTPFLVDLTPPSGTITATPQPWEPGDPDILVNPPQVTITLALTPGAAPVASWRLGVIHPDGRRFMDFIGEDHRDNTIVWAGRTPNNGRLEPGTTYDLVAQVFDRFGNVGTLKGTLAVAQAAPPSPVEPSAAPVTVSLDGRLIEATQVYFAPFSADLSLVKGTKGEANDQALGALAAALAQASDAKIRVVGHANQVFWQDPAKGAVEQETVLIPLSKARAEAVRQALVERGLNPGRFEVTGVGALGALAPFDDQAQNWKNRRVEFLLLEDQGS